MLLDRSWLARVRDISSGTHHVINPSPAFRTASEKSWSWRPGNEARFLALAEQVKQVHNFMSVNGDRKDGKEGRRYTCLASGDDCPVHKGLNMNMPNIAFSLC